MGPKRDVWVSLGRGNRRDLLGKLGEEVGEWEHEEEGWVGCARETGWGLDGEGE